MKSIADVEYLVSTVVKQQQEARLHLCSRSPTC